MTLDEYKAEIYRLAGAEDAPGHEGATAAAVGVLAYQIETACWQPGYASDARCIARWARDVQKQVTPKAG